MTQLIHRERGHLLFVLALILLAFALVACGPEAGRIDGDGKESGADIGNWSDTIELQGDDDRDVRIYYQTPDEQPSP